MLDRREFFKKIKNQMMITIKKNIKMKVRIKIK